VRAPKPDVLPQRRPRRPRARRPPRPRHHIYVWLHDLLPKRSGPGAAPKLSDAELIALAVAQGFLDCQNDRRFLALARWRLGQLFPCLPKQPGYNKRVRAAAPQILAAVNAIRL
jgi:hypothetical protein